MTAGNIADLFSTPAYWLEAVVIILIFVIINMFPCTKSAKPNSHLPTPIRAFTDAFGRESTIQERCDAHGNDHGDSHYENGGEPAGPLDSDYTDSDTEGECLEFEYKEPEEHCKPNYPHPEPRMEDCCCVPDHQANPLRASAHRKRNMQKGSRSRERKVPVRSHCRSTRSGCSTQVKAYSRRLPSYQC